MPWNEIESGTYDERINAVRTLIRLRKTKKACKSEKIIWQNTGHARVIGYRKEMEGEPAVEVRLNASKEKVKLPECREMLFPMAWKTAGSCRTEYAFFLYRAVPKCAY